MTTSVEGAVDIEVGGAPSRLTADGATITIDSPDPAQLLAEALAAGRASGVRTGAVRLYGLLGDAPEIRVNGPSGPVLRTRPGRRIPITSRRPLTLVRAWWRSR